ncbi:MAG TPA: HAMP domain-containing sensor histidine kinase [Steroidobacteraceae bacterium]|nr:HAMP domain-containing sensor histidine kinase [Steroidobacteraceae bacterium]
MLSIEAGKIGERVKPRARDLSDEDENLAEESRLARFGATIAHELRGPLAPIVNGMHILKARSHDDAKSQQVLAMMERQLLQLTSLLEDLMDVGGLRSSNVRTEHERVDMHHVISASVEACAAAIDSRQQEVKIESDGQPLCVRGDTRRLTQVFTNLLTNSNKYTPAGGHIAIRLSQDDDEVRVDVRDDGMGMAIEDLPDIFDLFRQGAEHRYSPQRGLGIGLSVVKNIVQLHGGSVAAHSDGPGRGSLFTVRLPRCD